MLNCVQLNTFQTFQCFGYSLQSELSYSFAVRRVGFEYRFHCTSWSGSPIYPSYQMAQQVLVTLDLSHICFVSCSEIIQCVWDELDSLFMCSSVLCACCAHFPELYLSCSPGKEKFSRSLLKEAGLCWFLHI